MIDSDISGVMFTTNPITGNPSELLIEAVYGLGELLVQGEVTPESITIDKTTGNILITPHHQKEKLVFVNGKDKRIPLVSHYKNQKIMDSSKLRKLQELSEKIATIYDFPQDIEWAFAGDKLYVLQSRPITTLV